MSVNPLVYYNSHFVFVAIAIIVFAIFVALFATWFFNRDKGKDVDEVHTDLDTIKQDLSSIKQRLGIVDESDTEDTVDEESN